MYMVRLLKENNVRTMDIAKMIQISERSVTRLLAKTKDMTVIEYNSDIIADVEKLLADKDQILDCEELVVDEQTEQTPNTSTSKPTSRPKKKPETCRDNTKPELSLQGGEESKHQLGVSLLAMNVRFKDIAKMLDVTEKTVQKWKAELDNEDYEEDSAEEIEESTIYDEF